MDGYDNWGRSELKRLMSGIRSLNVEPHTQPVFYSGPSRQDGEQVRNRTRAENYALREGATTLEMTDRGKDLEAKRDTIVTEASQIVRPSSAILYLRQEWEHTSGHFAQLARGDVKAFVAGADKKDVFYKKELTDLISSPLVKTINGVQRDELHKIVASGADGFDRAHHIVARAGARQDMAQAIRTGDRELIRDALAQTQLYMNQMQRDRGERFDDSTEAYAKRAARLDHKADQLAATRQAEIRAEALSDAKTYIDSRLQAGRITQEQAERMMSHAEQSAQDPQKAYRMSKLARLKRVRDNAIQGEPDIQGIHNYLNGKEQYQKDMRAVRQANGQRLVASNPIDRQIIRRHHQRSLAGHAELKCRNRRGGIKNYAKAEGELDQSLQAQLVQERENVTRPQIHRLNTNSAAHRL